MLIDIRTTGFELTPGLREHTERRLAFALDRARYDVRKIAVRLSDINGPRGGLDKRCRIQIALSGRQDVVIEDTESDLYVAIDRAIDRSSRSVARQLGRMHEHREARRKAHPVTEQADDDAVATGYLN